MNPLRAFVLISTVCISFSCSKDYEQIRVSWAPGHENVPKCRPLILKTTYGYTISGVSVPVPQAGTALVCFASMAAHVGATDNAAADAAIDDPLAPGMFGAWVKGQGDLDECAVHLVLANVARDKGHGLASCCEFASDSQSLYDVPDDHQKVNHIVATTVGRDWAVEDHCARER